MTRPKTRTYTTTYCTYCNAPLERPTSSKRHHFCSQSHYWAWLREKRPIEEIRYASTQGELQVELQRVANELGHLPSRNEFSANSPFSPKRYETRFGSWRIALTCITDPSPQDNWNINDVPIADGSWLSGFADGESMFRLSKTGTSFCPIWGFQIRADDMDAACEARRILSLQSRPFTFWHRDGDRKRGINAGDAIRFFIRDIPTHHQRIVPIFQKFPLRSKKSNEFTLFAEAVNLLYKHQSNLSSRKYPQSLRERLNEIKLILHEMKKYKDPRNTQ